MTRRGISLSDLSPRHQAEVSAQLHGPRVIEAKPAERRIRQDHRPKMNKLESAYNDLLLTQYQATDVLAQAVRLELANNQWYKPDFYIPYEKRFFEVKGPKSFRGGFENLKSAARIHRWANFVLVWRKDGQWYSQEVLP